MSQIVEVKVPDIGDFADVPVIELYVKAGDAVKVDDALVTLESDKATVDVPSSVAGVVKEVLVRLGDKVSRGSLLLTLEAAAPAAEAATAPAGAGPAAQAPVAAGLPASAPAAPAPTTEVAGKPAPTSAGVAVAPAAATAPPSPAAPPPAGARVHASPSVRAYARELGVDLARVKASGPKNRILREDVSAFVKGAMTSGVVPGAAAAAGAITGGGTLDLLPWPKVDFTKFGPVEVKPLSRIKKISGANLARNWVMIPAVTYHEDADITELEAFRVQLNKENEKSGVKVTMLAFLIKACVAALKQFPEFNASLDVQDGEMSLVLKRYIHIGFAADTPNGLTVPVIRDADRKGVVELARETGELAGRAREGKLAPGEMQGACFTISSVGGLGGTAFSPIVNAPEVAILGVSRSAMKPLWDGTQFVPRLVLPLSLSADHRVIDGAMATRFNAHLARLLADFRRVLL